MPIRFIVLAVTGVIIVAIAIIAIVMSTSSGADACESIWNTLEGEGKDKNDEPPAD